MAEPVAVSLEVDAPPEMVYALVADLTRMGELSPETVEVTWLDGAAAAVPGARFRGANRRGRRSWSTTCTIVTADPGRELSWRSSSLGLSVALWSYRFDETATGGTLVTETTVDERSALLRRLAPLATGVPDRAAHNAVTMRATLERIKAEVETAS